jgi:hypothetical protein
LPPEALGTIDGYLVHDVLRALLPPVAGQPSVPNIAPAQPDQQAPQPSLPPPEVAPPQQQPTGAPIAA